MSEPDADTYALKSVTLAEIPAPDLPYQPPMPRAYRPRIGDGELASRRRAHGAGLTDCPEDDARD